MIINIFLVSDKSRFLKWLEACNNPRIQKLDAISVHKRYRICRRHFDAECLNGGCRRLLNTAVPTLHLSPDQHRKQDESSNLITSDIVYVPIASKNDSDDGDDHYEYVLTENKTLVSTKEIKRE